MSWSTEDRRWTVDVTRADTGERLRFTTDFLWMCQGYYNHEKPYQPRWEGMDRFQGRIVHPQQWPDDLDYTGKRVVVIGSGSTAATLIPAIAKTAAHVTMLQRSPSYFFAAPTTHELAVMLEPLDLPPEWTHEILRRQYLPQFDWLARTSLEAPDELHEFLMEGIRPLLPEGFDIEKHFTPRYRPWQQRIAIVPDGDFFAALREGKASIVTDTIEEFTEKGIRLSSGEELEADVVVTATGLQPVGVRRHPVHRRRRGGRLHRARHLARPDDQRRAEHGLRVRLLPPQLDAARGPGQRPRDPADGEHGSSRTRRWSSPTLRAEDADMQIRPWSDPENFNAGYVMRSQHVLFKQGDREPWTHMQEHDEEQELLPKADLDDGSLVYR